MKCNQKTLCRHLWIESEARLDNNCMHSCAALKSPKLKIKNNPNGNDGKSFFLVDLFRNYSPFGRSIQFCMWVSGRVCRRVHVMSWQHCFVFWCCCCFLKYFCCWMFGQLFCFCLTFVSCYIFDCFSFSLSFFVLCLTALLRCAVVYLLCLLHVFLHYSFSFLLLPFFVSFLSLPFFLYFLSESCCCRVPLFYYSSVSTARRSVCVSEKVKLFLKF